MVFRTRATFILAPYLKFGARDATKMQSRSCLIVIALVDFYWWYESFFLKPLKDIYVKPWLNPLRATHSFWRLIFLHSGCFCYQSRILRRFLSPMGDFKAPLKSTGRGDIPRTPVDSWGEKSCSCRDVNVCWTSHLSDSWQKSCISWYLIPDFSDRTNSPLWSPIAKFHPYPERSPLGAKL